MEFFVSPCFHFFFEIKTRCILQCFSSASILQECTDDRNVTEEAIAKLVLYLSYGFCILPEPLYFQEELLEYLDADPNGFVTEKSNRVDFLQSPTTVVELL